MYSISYDESQLNSISNYSGLLQACRRAKVRSIKPEEELLQLRAENQALRQRIEQQDSQLAQRDNLVAQLLERVQGLEERLSKESHNTLAALLGPVRAPAQESA